MSPSDDVSRRPTSQVRGSTTDDLSTSNQHNRPVAKTSNGSVPPDRRKPDHHRNPRLLAAEKQTRRLARSHYENFLVASVFLPRRLQQPFYNLYAFCRTADDLADESESDREALLRLEAFQRELGAAFEGNPSDGLFLALADTIERFQLAKLPFDELLDAFRQDQRKSRYATFAEVLDYCRRSANPVGRIVLTLADCDDAESAELSDCICTGLQLANFLQDVSRDYRKGRIYLAKDEMSRFGVNETMFGQSATPQPLRDCIASECQRAEAFLRRGLPLAGRVPRWFSVDVRLFAHGGLATLESIRRIDFDVLRIRPTVSKGRQLSLLLRAGLGLL